MPDADERNANTLNFDNRVFDKRKLLTSSDRCPKILKIFLDRKQIETIEMDYTKYY